MPASAPPARAVRAVLFLLTIGTLKAARIPHQTTQLKIVCQERVSQLCWTWPLAAGDVQLAVRKLHRVPQQYLCGISDSTETLDHMEIYVSSSGNDVTVATCKRTIQRPMDNLNDWSMEYRKGSRQRRQVSYRGRFRGQTQSQYLAIDQEANKDEGKAEAISAADTSKAVVSGRSGMGQAQSQSMYDPSCDECVDRYVPGSESRPTGGNRGNSDAGPGGVGTNGGNYGNTPGTHGRIPGDGSNLNPESVGPYGGPTGNNRGHDGRPGGPDRLDGTPGGPGRSGEDGHDNGLRKPSSNADGGNKWPSGGQPGEPRVSPSGGENGGRPDGKTVWKNPSGGIPGTPEIPGGGNNGNIQINTPGSDGNSNSVNQPPIEIRRTAPTGNKPGTGYWPPVLTGVVPGVPQGSTYFCCVVGANPPQYIGTGGGGFGINGNTGQTIFNLDPNGQGGLRYGQGVVPGNQVGSGGQSSPLGGGWNGQGGGPGSQGGGWNGQAGGPGSQGSGSGGPGSALGGWNGQGGGPGSQGAGWNGQAGGPGSQGGGSGGQGGPSGGGWNGQGGPGSRGGGWNGQGSGPGSQGGISGGQGGPSGGGWNVQGGPSNQGGGWNGQAGGPGIQGGASGGQGGLSGGGWNGQGGVPGSQGGGSGGQGGPLGGGPGSQGGGWNGQGGVPGSQGGGSGGQGGPLGGGPGSQVGGWNGQRGGPGSQGGGSGGQGSPSGGGWTGQGGGPGSQGGGWNGQGSGPGNQGGGPSGGEWSGQGGGPSSQGGGSIGQGSPLGGGWNGQAGGPGIQGSGSGGHGGPSGGGWNGQGGLGSQGGGWNGQGGGSGGQGGPSGGGWNGQGGGPGSQGGGWNGQAGGPGSQGSGSGGPGSALGGWNGQGGGPGSQGAGWNGQAGGPGSQGGGSSGQGGPSGGGWNGQGGGPGSQGGGWNGQGGGPGSQGGAWNGQGGRPGGQEGGWNGQRGGPGSQGSGSGGQGGPSGDGWNVQGGGPSNQGGGWNEQTGGPGNQGGASGGQGGLSGGGWNGQGGNEQTVPDTNGQHVPPQNVIEPNSIAADGDDSQAESSITQNGNGTMAIASSNGGNDKGRAKTQVSGTYAGSGTFSAQAEISDESKGAQSEVSGGKHGAISIAQGHSRNSKSQANVNLGSETGSLTSGAQSDGVMHSSNTQVQGGVKGGSAEAQARGPGSTSSQAQIGFTPFKDSDKARHDQLKTPFVGAGKASSHSNGRIGESQSQLEGTFKYGIKYTGAAQSGASLDKDAVFASRLPFNKIDVFDKSNVNINVDDTETPPDITPLPLPDINDLQNNVVNITEKPQDNHRDRLNGHTHLDHHIQGNENKAAPMSPPPAGKTRSFQSPYANNNADFDYTSDKEDNPSEDYDADGGFGPEGSEAVDGEYNYEDFGKESETHQSLQTPSRKSFEIKQSNGGNTQHIVLGALHGQDAHITQRNTYQRPDETRIYQPGESVPGTDGYTIPVGFTGSVKSVASKQNTYAIGTRRSPSQAQTVSLTPGSGKVKYLYPNPNVSPYGKYVAPKDLRSYSNNDDSNRYVSVSKTVTGALDNENNIRKQYSHTYYTKSSSCGYFTFTCTMVSGPDGRKKVCKPKIPTNPDGTPMRC